MKSPTFIRGLLGFKAVFVYWFRISIWGDFLKVAYYQRLTYYKWRITGRDALVWTIEYVCALISPASIIQHVLFYDKDSALDILI